MEAAKPNLASLDLKVSVLKIRRFNMAEGLCTKEADEDDFHDDKKISAEHVQRAIAVCRKCPIWEPCLIFAYANDLKGVYGGTTSRQRNLWRKTNEERKKKRMEKAA